MSRHTLFIATAVLGLACSWAEAGKATATVGISARVDAFAEWRAGETPTSVTTATGGRSVRIAKTLTLFANTDVTVTLAPHLNVGVLTADNREALQTAATLTGDVEPAERREHAPLGSVHRLRHLPGRRAYDVTLDVRATLPAGMVVQSTTCATSVQRAGRNSQRVDAAFEVNASGQDSPAPKAYRCGFSITVSWD